MFKISTEMNEFSTAMFENWTDSTNVRDFERNVMYEISKMFELSTKIFKILKEMWDFDWYVLDFDRNVTDFKNFDVGDFDQNVGDFNRNVYILD